RIEQEAVEIFEKQGNPRFEGISRAYLATILVMSGDLTAAERQARAATKALLSMPPQLANALAVLARVLLGQGRAKEALAAAEEASALLASLGTIEEGESLIRLVYAEALAGNGREREFAEAIAVARDRLLARAACISDPHWRERFLTAVPDNAGTLALAAR